MLLYPQWQPLLSVKQVNDGDVRSREFDQSICVVGDQVMGDPNNGRQREALIHQFQQQYCQHLLFLVFAMSLTARGRPGKTASMPSWRLDGPIRH